jgi:hypothetical protein
MAIDDKFSGDLKIEWLEVPQLNEETSVSVDYHNAFYDFESKLKNQLFGGLPAAMKHAKENPIPTYQEHIRQLEENYSKTRGHAVKFEQVVYGKNEGQVEMLNSIAMRINAMAASYNPDDKSVPDDKSESAESKIKFLLELRDKILGGNTPRWKK